MFCVSLYFFPCHSIITIKNQNSHKIKCSYLSQGLLQDYDNCLKSAVTSCQKSSEMLAALFLPTPINDTRWYHIRRSVTLARLGSLLIRRLLTGAGLGFVPVHCERTCVECRDNVDHHYTPLHSCCSCSDSSTTHPIHCCQGHRCSKVQCQSVGYFCSSNSDCSVQSVSLINPSAAPPTTQT